MASLNLEDLMASTLSKQKPAPRKQLARRTPTRSSAKLAKPTSSNTKHSKIIAMLGSAAGTTITALMKATGWQQHSVRGFLAAVVRKKLKLNLVSERKDDKDRVYRIVELKNSKHLSTKPTVA